MRISTEMADLTLIALTPGDASRLYRLVANNREHLSRHGDYQELIHATYATITDDLMHPADQNARFGIWLGESLIGRADLSPRATGHYVIGYWLGRDFTGKGYATMACRALIQYGCEQLGATDIYAGVTKGNVQSEAVLVRLGFERIEDRDTYTLFRLMLGAQSDT